MKRKQVRLMLLMIMVVIGLCGLRLVHLTADPPAHLSWSGGLFFDEGAYTHNARNQILFGEWKADEWNDFYYSPILTLLKWGIFSIIGIGIAQERLVSILFCGLTLWMLYLALSVTLRRSVAILSVILLGINYIYVMYSRLGMFEIPLIFFMVLTMYFWQQGLKHQPRFPVWRSHAFMFLAGVSCFTVYIFKALAIYFLPVPVVSFVILWITMKTADERKRLLKSAGMFLAGMAATVMLWYVTFFAPNYEAIHGIGTFITSLSLPHSFRQFFQDILATPFFAMFLRTPIVLAVSVVYLLVPLYLLLHRRFEVEPIDIFLGLWFFAHFFFFLGYGYRPPRYYIPIIPPMCGLAARGLVWAVQTRALKIPYKIVLWFWGIFWIFTWLLWVEILIPGLYRYGAIPFITVPPMSQVVRVTLGSMLSLCCTAFAFRFTHQHRGETVFVPHRFLLAVVAVLLLSSVLINGRQYLQWAARPQYVIRTISRELGTMLDHAYIAGLATPMLCLENTHRALYVWKNFTNYQNTFKRFPVTHLFLGEFNDEVRYYQRRFPEVMKRATLLKTYWIKGGRFHLYSIVDPTIEQITVEPPPYVSTEPISVQLTVKNNDPRHARNIEAGWLLIPSDDLSSPVTAQTTLRLNSLEQQTITVSKQVPSGEYMLMAALFPSHQDHYEAEDLAYQIGRNVPDPQASNGMARYAEAGRAGFLTYGPYHRYQSGFAESEFLIKTSAPTSGTIAHLDVSADVGKTILAQQLLTAQDINPADGYHAFRLSYRIEMPHNLEFRVATLGTHEVWVDRVTTNFLKGTWIESPILIQE